MLKYESRDMRAFMMYVCKVGGIGCLRNEISEERLSV